MDRIEGLQSALDAAIQRSCQGERIAVLFSGGVDSGVLASLSSRWAQVTLYTVGLPGAHDLAVAEKSALTLKLPWVPITIEGEDIEGAIPPLVQVLDTQDPLTISFELPTYFVAQRCAERVMLCGQGADELFGGYSRYLTAPNEARRSMMRSDLDRLLGQGVPRERRIAQLFSKELLHPFLDESVVQRSRELPDDLLVQEGRRKVALRQLAERLDLQEMASRPKKAAQYGSGIMREMKRRAKGQGSDLSQWVSSIVEQGGA